MKKILLYSLAALASVTLAGCAGDYDDWASPQSNAQEDAAAQYGVTLSAGSEAISTMPDADGTVHLVAISSSNEDVEGFSVNSVTINGEEVDASVEDNEIVIDGTTLAKLVDEVYGSRASVARQLEVVSDVSINLSNGDAVTGATGTTTATITPAVSPGIDANGYYLLGDFVGNGWDNTSPLWMDDQGDGTYKLTVETKSSGSNYYGFYMGSNYGTGTWDEINTGVLGSETSDNTALSGLLAYTDDPIYDSPKSMVISGQGTYEITLDMNNLTYSIVRAEAKYYVVGTVNGWSSDNAYQNMFYTQGSNIYTYTALWTGAWDLKIWDSNTLGNWDAAWGTSIDGDGSESGSLINSNAQSFQSPAAGYYTLTINMSDMTYTWTILEDQEPTEYTSISLIGDFNGWGDDVDMEQVCDHNWFVEYTVPSDGGLKFRADHDWTDSWGTSDTDTAVGDAYYLPLGTGNINVPAGTYYFYFNDITGEWNIVKQ